MKKSTILEVGAIIKKTILTEGKNFDEIAIQIKINDDVFPKGYSIGWGAFTLREDENGKYVDFTRTRYKDLGKYYI